MDVIIYPNPFLNVVTVDLGNLESAKIKIINAFGQVMLSEEIEKRSNQLNLIDLSSGTYFVIITCDIKVLVKKNTKE